MKFVARTLRKLAQRIDPAKPMRRAYAGAAMNHVFANWIASQTTGDAELRGSIRTLLDRSRELERNNAHMAAFLRAVEMNVAGPSGFTFQSNVTEPKKDSSGIFRDTPDDLANSRIEEAFYRWAKPRFCTANKQLSYAAFQRLLIRTVARDGSALVRKITGTNSRNEFGFSLQLLEVDHLDLNEFATMPNGNVVKFGIELDQFGAPVSFGIFTVHPGDSSTQATRQRQKIRIPASEMMLVMMPRRASQVIGDPWVVSAMGSLKNLGKLEEYELIASMVSASKMGFYVKTGEGADAPGIGEESAEGTMVSEAVPGAFEQLPQGWDVKTWDPTHPNDTIHEFAKLIIRQVAVGCGVAASTVSGDLSDTNYSSMRAGLGEEREAWKMIQTWLCETVIEPIFEEWLSFAMLSGAINLPFTKFDKFNKPKFHGRRWASVNPVEDANAMQTMITMGVTSRTQFIAQNGGDFQETIRELGNEMALAESLGVPIIAKDPYQNQTAMLDNQNGGVNGGNK